MRQDKQLFRRFILDSVPVAMITMDAELRITCFNRRAEILTGYQAVEAIGRPCHEILRSSLCADNCPLQTVHHHGESATGLEGELVNRFDERVAVRIGTAALENRQGDFVGYLEVIEDISREKALLRERDNFLFMVVHDMKSPLTAMQGLVRRLHERFDSLDGKRARAYLATIIEAGEQLEKRISEFLDFSRQTTDNIVLSKSDVDLRPLLETLLRRHGQRAAQQKITLRFKHRLEGTISADAQQLQRVFENLLDNAISFTPPGGTITISTSRPQEGGALIEVHDSGAGIDPRHLPYIFDAFYKGGQSSGHGLGLAGARAIVRRHGGHISVASAPGQGTTFAVRLP